MISLDIDTRPFESYAARLAQELNPRNPQSVLPQVVRSEVASVVKIAANQIKPASQKKIREDRRFNALRRIDDGKSVIAINSGKKGGVKHRVWFGVKDGGRPGKGGRTWYPIGIWNRGKSFSGGPWRLPRARWQDARRLWRDEQHDADLEVQQGLKARGLSLQGWVQIIDSLGVNLSAVAPRGISIPPYVRTARPRSGRALPNLGRSSEFSGPGEFSISIVNASTAAIRLGGARHLQAGIRIRRAAFEQALARGVFDRAEQVARLYPGITVTP
jgi:hypothetical protein